MKWDSLGWNERGRLEKLYDQRHEVEIPVKPERFEQVQQYPRVMIRTADHTDLYVRMEASTSSYRSEGDYAQGALRIVGTGEHVEIKLPLDCIDAVIEQLQQLKTDMQAHNAAFDAHLKANKDYEAAKKTYEDRRQLALEKTLMSGKYTEQQIKHEPEKIPF